MRVTSLLASEVARRTSEALPTASDWNGCLKRPTRDLVAQSSVDFDMLNFVYLLCNLCYFVLCNIPHEMHDLLFCRCNCVKFRARIVLINPCCCAICLTSILLFFCTQFRNRLLKAPKEGG